MTEPSSLNDFKYASPSLHKLHLQHVVAVCQGEMTRSGSVAPCCHSALAFGAPSLIQGCYRNTVVKQRRKPSLFRDLSLQDVLLWYNKGHRHACFEDLSMR